MAYSTRGDIPNRREISLTLAISVVMHVLVIAALLLDPVVPATEESRVSMPVMKTFNVAYKAPRPSHRPLPEPKKITTVIGLQEKSENPEKSILDPLVEDQAEHAERPEIKGDAAPNFGFFVRAVADMRSSFGTDEGRISQTVFINSEAKPVTCSADKVSDGVVDSRLGCLFAMTFIYQHMAFPRGIPESSYVKLDFEWSSTSFKATNEESVVTVYKDGSISFVDLKASPSGRADGLNADQVSVLNSLSRVDDVHAPEDVSSKRGDIDVAAERS